MGLNHGTNIVKDGLVFYVDAANPRSYVSGSTTTTNLMNSNVTGSLKNQTHYTSINAGSWDFDGVDDYILSNTGSNSLAGPYSISLWFKLDAINSSAMFAGWGTMNAGNYKRRYIGHWNGGSGDHKIISSTNGSNVLGTTSLTTDTWFYGTVTLASNREAKIYTNGVLETTGTNTTSSYLTNDIYIGVSPSLGEDFNGQMSNVMIYNRVITAQEVKQNYNALKSRFGL